MKNIVRNIRKNVSDNTDVYGLVRFCNGSQVPVGRTLATDQWSVTN